jgi:flagellar biogenesis protein FliO
METIQQAGSVVFVLALLLLTLWWVRRRGLANITGGLPIVRKTNARRLESMERLPLGPQHTLHLVRLGAAALLISASPAGCALVHRADWREIENAGGTQ